jgi:hypothetical protein
MDPPIRKKKPFETNPSCPSDLSEYISSKILNIIPTPRKRLKDGTPTDVSNPVNYNNGE